MAFERGILSDMSIFVVVPTADNHNSCTFVIKSDKIPLSIAILDRNKSDHLQIYQSFFFLDKIRTTFFLASKYLSYFLNKKLLVITKKRVY